MDKNKILEMGKYIFGSMLTTFILGAIAKIFFNIFQMGWNLF